MIEYLLEHRIQIVAILASLGLMGFILELIRRRSLKEEYSLLWLFMGVVFLFFSFWREGLDFFANLVGVKYPPAALLMILLLGAFGILMHYSTVISKLSVKNKDLVQEISLLKNDFEKFRDKIENKDS